MLEVVRNAAREAAAVLFPISCAGCGAPDHALCGVCRALLGPDRSPQWVDQYVADTVRVVSALRYEGPARSMILALKEHGRTDIARALATPLRVAIESAVAGETSSVELCAVPSSRQSLRRRGYSPVDVLARAGGFRLAPVLRHASSAHEQKLLDRTQRALNIRGSLSARAVTARRFVLVDDVVTSGSTLLESARALRAAGGEVIAAATLAYTPRHVSQR